ncbi:MAG TPA: hypothetical protein VIY86_08060 [Pirellulaceae bacterium]
MPIPHRSGANRSILASVVASSTAELLSWGGDSRMIVDPSSGLTRYGTAAEPWDDIVPLGSCTASTITRGGFQVAVDYHRYLRGMGTGPVLETALRATSERIRCEIWRLLTQGAVRGVDIVLTPSGTDAELLVLALAHGNRRRRIRNIVVGPGEVGSGTVSAASGWYFDARIPNDWRAPERPRVPGSAVDPWMAERTTVETVWLRDVDGRPRDARDLDAEVSQLVREAIGRGESALLHVVAHSKTGVYAPSWDLVQSLRREFGETLVVVLDAAQGRMRRAGLVQALRNGWIVLTTGSKFHAGPPFCGALLVPSSMHPHWRGVARVSEAFGDLFTDDMLPETWTTLRHSLPSTPNPGLALRWLTAVAHMGSYYAIPPMSRYRRLRAFQRQVSEALEGSPVIELATDLIQACHGWENRMAGGTTVFTLSLRRRAPSAGCLGMEELQGIHRALNQDLSPCAPSRGSELQRILATRFHVGQPVGLGRETRGGPAQLRIALSATLQMRRKWEDPDTADSVYLPTILSTFRKKLEWIVDHLDLVQKEDVTDTQIVRSGSGIAPFTGSRP